MFKENDFIINMGVFSLYFLVYNELMNVSHINHNIKEQTIFIIND